jgi:hypothetical protein
MGDGLDLSLTSRARLPAIATRSAVVAPPARRLRATARTSRRRTLFRTELLGRSPRRPHHERVHLLFLDESGRLEEDGLFALGGIALRDRDWAVLRDAWRATLAAHAWPAERELKWHDMRTGAVPPALADDAVDALARAPVTAYVTLLDLRAGPLAFPPESYPFFASPADVYQTGLMFLSERFHYLLQAEDDLGVIVVDSRFRESDARLRRFFADLADEGTPYVRLDRIVEGLFLGPSNHSLGLQCADLVVSIAAAAERGNGQARGYLRKLMPRFAVHPVTGDTDGCGVKRFPDVPRPPALRLFAPRQAEPSPRQAPVSAS